MQQPETFTLPVSLHFSRTHNLTHAHTHNLQRRSVTTNHGRAVIMGCNQREVSVMNIARGHTHTLMDRHFKSVLISECKLSQETGIY